ncbi:MAG: phosphotransferase [Propionibacteriales bacterium]|nr:phosphotransferase [Propionibacteriales bacterium]
MDDHRRVSPWARSVPTTGAVAQLVADHYALAPAQATLVRTFVNDVYRIDTEQGPYALKLYGHGRWSADEVRWEQSLAHELDAAGVPVAGDVALCGGDSVGILTAPEGERPFALTTWVPGEKPQPPWSDVLYAAVGAALARFHAAVDAFDCEHPRPPVRKGDEPARVVAVLDQSDPRRDLVQHSADAANSALDQLAARGLRWGVTHGDASLDNLHVDERGVVHFYDLDLAGPGWQMSDLTGAMSTEFAAPFLAAYVAERPLSDVELAALPWLRILGHIDNLAFHLIDKPAAMGSATLAEGWVDRGFAGLADAAGQAGLDVDDLAVGHGPDDEEAQQVGHEETLLPSASVFDYRRASRQRAEGRFGSTAHAGDGEHAARMGDDRAKEFEQRLLALTTDYFSPGAADPCMPTKYGFRWMLTPVDLAPADDPRVQCDDLTE